MQFYKHPLHASGFDDSLATNPIWKINKPLLTHPRVNQLWEYENDL